ncbi:MAG: DUF2256 domain-containing protein [Verrucomicrobiaceae bacterium]|nr:DUF2256 domain-containing protein [bacterium]NCF90752.1 DUF2256 domain-containing protein [Verrucomicrobiaceae bacterium]
MAHKKVSLPSKICPACNRPFVWRKKWVDCWREVKWCSQRCRRRAKSDSARDSA